MAAKRFYINDVAIHPAATFLKLQYIYENIIVYNNFESVKKKRKTELEHVPRKAKPHSNTC